MDAIDSDNLTLLGWVRCASFYKFYNDDGLNPQPKLEDGLKTILFEMKDGKPCASGDGLTLDVSRVIVKE